MTLRYITALSCVTLALVACSEAPPTAGVAKNFDAVCDKANDGKRVAVEGYLRLPSSFKGSQSVILRLYKGKDFKSASIGVLMPLGNQVNQVESVPKQYTDKDLKVHLGNGQVAGLGTKLKVSGKVYFPLVGQEFACALENPLAESVK